jgi:small subunit ribosomal protein S3Ae
VDPFLKKEWYKLVAPSMFNIKDCGVTIVTKTQGTKIASDELKGRVLELSLADLIKEKEAECWRKIKLCIEDVQGYNCLLNFHGMDMTRDKLCNLIKKRKSIIEASVDVRTTDGYMIRMFCIAFTKKQQGQQKATCYATHAKTKGIRAKMVQYMNDIGSKGDLKSLVQTLITADCGKVIEKSCNNIFPIEDCYIRKVKVLKKPKFDVTALMEWHTEDATADVGTAVKPADESTEVKTSTAGAGGRY